MGQKSSVRTILLIFLFFLQETHMDQGAKKEKMPSSGHQYKDFISQYCVVVLLSLGRVPTTPDPNTSEKVSRCKWSYRPKAGVTDQKSELQPGRTNHPERGPMGFRCFYRNPPLELSWFWLKQTVFCQGCFTEWCVQRVAGIYRGRRH